jgi:pteridine reductase
MNAPHTPPPVSTAPVILITGAAKRVGAAIATLLHASGANVMLHYRSSIAAAEALAISLNAARPGSAAIVQAELGSQSAANALVEATLAQFGRLDGLVNNASSFYRTPLGAVDEAAWADLMDSNLKGPLFLAQAAAASLRDSGGVCGAIVNITDIHAERPLAGYLVYNAAKAGLLGLTRSLAVELAPQVRVNAVAPGAIVWPDQDDDFPPQERAAIIAHTLLKREGHPEDIARTVKFLLFDAPYITGQVINVDGGRTAHL